MDNTAIMRGSYADIARFEPLLSGYTKVIFPFPLPFPITTPSELLNMPYNATKCSTGALKGRI